MEKSIRNLKRGIYLASFKAIHSDHDLIYQDINGKRDLGGDMMNISLNDYDYIVATPPCNWWSRANYRRNSSKYALETKHLLIDILNKLIKLNEDSDYIKPFIVENVRNDKLFKEHCLFDLGLYIYKIGRHTYWSNVFVPGLAEIKQQAKIEFRDGKKYYLSSQNISRNQRQGGEDVHEVIETWLNYIETL